MKLKKWLETNEISYERFAEMLGIEQKENKMNQVFRYCREDGPKVIPRLDRMIKIMKLTKNKVRPQDFYGK